MENTGAIGKVGSYDLKIADGKAVASASVVEGPATISAVISLDEKQVISAVLDYIETKLPAAKGLIDAAKAGLGYV